LPWEFVEGARNWALPGLVAAAMKLSALAGGDSPEVYLPVVRLLFVALSMATAVGVYFLARRLGSSEAAAAAGAAAWALAAPAIYFAHRALGENVAAAAGVWAAALLLPRSSTRGRLWLGASLLGVAVLFRLHMGLVAVGLLAAMAVQQRWRDTRLVSGVLALWAFAYGAFDAVTWSGLESAKYGGWFHSAILYLRFNLVEGKAEEWGTSPASYYLVHIFQSMPFLAIAIAAGLIAGFKRTAGLTLTALCLLVAHSLVGHKEYRFVLPCIPLAMAAAAVGLDSLPGRLRVMAITAMAFAAVASGATFQSLTWGDLGAYPDRADERAWDDTGAINRLLMAAHRLPDLCGLRVDGHPAWQGGASHLHRRTPFYWDAPEDEGLYNYAITSDRSHLPVAAREGNMVLVKLPFVGTCTPPRHRFRWRLP
jgi:4-amino-4-deoxy-L-arabinose transferase-like glycosyltransferase